MSDKPSREISPAIEGEEHTYAVDALRDDGRAFDTQFFTSLTEGVARKRAQQLADVWQRPVYLYRIQGDQPEDFICFLDPAPKPNQTPPGAPD
jgi:hypothetical protein